MENTPMTPSTYSTTSADRDMLELRAGYDAGCAAGEAETQIGALFLGSAGSLRINRGGDRYQRTPYGIGYRCGYADAIEHKNFRTNALGKVVSVGA